MFLSLYWLGCLCSRLDNGTDRLSLLMERGPNHNLAIVVLLVFRNMFNSCFRFLLNLELCFMEAIPFYLRRANTKCARETRFWNDMGSNGFFLPPTLLLCGLCPSKDQANCSPAQKKEGKKPLCFSSLPLRTNTKNAGGWHQQSPPSLSLLIGQRRRMEGRKKKTDPFSFLSGNDCSQIRGPLKWGKLTKEGDWVNSSSFLLTLPRFTLHFFAGSFSSSSSPPPRNN